MNAVGPVFTPKQEVMCSPTYVYRKGAGQQFNQTDHIFQVNQRCRKFLGEGGNQVNIFWLWGRKSFLTQQVKEIEKNKESK